jgi:hypothetical protein
MLLTATSRQRVYQFRHERLGCRHWEPSGRRRIDGADVTNRRVPDKAYIYRATLVWRRQLSHRHKGYEAVVSFSSLDDVEVAGVKVGRVQAVEYNGLACAGLERRSISSVGEMGHHIEARADPGEVDDIMPRLEIGDRVALDTFRRREYEGVIPGSAGQHVVARAACELINAVAAHQMIVAIIAEQPIIAADSAVCITGDNIIASTTVKFVVPDAAVQLIVAIIAEHAIIAVDCAGVIPEHNITTITTVDVVVAGAGNDCVVPVSGIYKVVAVRTDYGVVPVSPDQRIRAVRARDDIECVWLEVSQ